MKNLACFIGLCVCMWTNPINLVYLDETRILRFSLSIFQKSPRNQTKLFSFIDFSFLCTAVRSQNHLKSCQTGRYHLISLWNFCLHPCKITLYFLVKWLFIDIFSQSRWRCLFSFTTILHKSRNNQYMVIYSMENLAYVPIIVFV